MLEKNDNLHFYIAAIFSGIILALPFIYSHFWWVTWFGLVPLLILIDRASTYKLVARLSFISGVAFFSTSLYWLYYASFMGLVIAVVYCSSYFLLFGLALKYIQNKKNPQAFSSIFITSSIWVICELIRSYLFTGFGWNQLGYSQFDNLRLIQIADFSGVYGVTFLIVLVNSFFKDIILSSREFVFYNKKVVVSKIVLGLVCLTIILGAYAYGDIKLNRELPQETIRISVIQGNIAQHQKWETFYRDMILQKYIRLSRMASIDKPVLIVWPETALPGYLEEYNLYKEVSDFISGVKISVLIGAPRVDSYNDAYYNSAVLFSKQGKVLNVYDKIHLVPFGEYIPLKGVLGFLYGYYEIANFSKGEIHTIFNLDNANFGVLICFEDVFESLVRTFVSRGADFMINITNDAWFYESAEPRQHLSASVFRAIENRVSFVRAANTGISGFIDPYGRIISKVNKSGKQICIEGFATADIPLVSQRSFYNRFGNVFVGFCFILLLFFYFKPTRI
ncbi:MAG: apolipoprotein N-acyltransferase [Candidatus Kappaea frigidicola]|nr:apolipoprotein N-acyltransferase [Candidatus Kappaea frigidicola]